MPGGSDSPDYATHYHQHPGSGGIRYPPQLQAGISRIVHNRIANSRHKIGRFVTTCGSGAACPRIGTDT
jgi:hypothetical protein